MLAFLTLKMGVAIGKEIDTVIPDDDASLAARVPWQASVACGIDVASAYALAHLEQRSHFWIGARSDSSIEPTVRCREGKRRTGLR